MDRSIIGGLLRGLTSVLFALSLMATASAGETYMPFVSAASVGTTVEEAAAAVVGKLEGAGFDVVGQYSPYVDGSAAVIGVTNQALKEAAGRHAFGGFGAVLRVAVTDNNGAIEVSYVNPQYMGRAYHIGELDEVAAQMRAALGGGEAFGAKGLTADDLEKYHYMMFMPSFADREVIAEFGSNEEAVVKVAQALLDPRSDMSAIWQVRINDNQTLFGVQLQRGKWDGKMKEIMSKIDVGNPKSTASLPWELLVTGNGLAYLPGKYRIALMFPDLSMGTFMQISDIPDNMAESADKLARIAQGRSLEAAGGHITE